MSLLNDSYIFLRQPNLLYPYLIAEVYSVAIVREEGSSGDREMAAAFYLAGFAVFDVNMEDFLDSRFSLSFFNGIVFVGGSAYADFFGAAKGTLLT